jgi:hypothetical protein
MLRLFLLFAVVCTPSCASTALAHFVWIDVQHGMSNPVQARVFFSENPEPGSARLIDRLKTIEAWACAAGAQPRTLKLAAWRDAALDRAALTADLPEGDCCLTAKCRYGVIEREGLAVLLHYYARHLPGGISQSTDAIELPLDIVPASGPVGRFRVLWKGRPVPDAEVVVLASDGDGVEQKTDSEGLLKLAFDKAGSFALRARYVEPDQAGVLDGKSYSQAWHYATLTFEVPAAASPAAQQPAGQVLAAARGHRAVWNDFPGFCANMDVWFDGTHAAGEILVNKSGQVEFKGLEQLGEGFVDRHLSSLVMHRLAGRQFDEKASFEEDDHHVLGRRLRLADDRMGSVYRIRDDVITEVNRIMGNKRFTISVLDVSRNDEGKYLPRVFTVSYWDTATGKLESSETVFHDWKRVGRFDLPRSLVVVSAGDGGKRQVLKVGFSDHQLLVEEQARPTE